MPRFRQKPSSRRQARPTASWETPQEQVKLVLLTSRPGDACDVPGHGTEEVTSMQGKSIPAGLCQCGCGGKTSVPGENNASKRWVKGRPLRFVNGHYLRFDTPAWIEEDRGHGTPSWIWQRAMYRSGYGAMKFAGHMHNAHRGVYLKLRGSIPGDLPLDHLCRVRACVNPAHLEPVPSVENIRRGERATLTAAQAAEIRASDEMGTVLAARYGVHPNTVYHVRKGRTWRAA
jgi:hypothetical protein